jgi:Na+-translocating ferredoxin:NAD+ oxidoreductase RnfC subunit
MSVAGPLTEPQKRLLERVRAKGVVPVRGHTLRTADALKRKGLIDVRIRGVAWSADTRWWFEAVPRERSN